jgi:uncharacterized protein (TIGR03435 family)
MPLLYTTILLVLGSSYMRGPFVQTATIEPPAFEVVSIKPTQSRGIIGGRCHGVDSKFSPAAATAPPLGRCRFERVSLRALISLTYHKPTGESPKIVGGDPWVGSENYDIEAKAEDPEHTTEAQLQSMVQTMLRTEFKLQFHYETHDEAGFALTRIPNATPLKEYANTTPQPGVLNQAPVGGLVIVPNGAGRTMKAQGYGIGKLAQFVGGNVGRPVIDKTGLVGLYDITLTWTPTVGDGIGPRRDEFTDPQGATFVTALREQLGLRLEPQKVPVETLVIDRAATPNLN